MTRMMPFGTMLGNGNFGMHSGYSWFWGILTFLWLTIIILLIILLVRRVSAQTAGKKSTPALDILKERYAKGEIGQEEFEQKKRGLAA
jgi:putative membrane protein